ncbi:hypothetical protein ACTMU2_30225 [Cupriavidus basilensis]
MKMNRGSILWLTGFISGDRGVDGEDVVRRQLIGRRDPDRRTAGSDDHATKVLG